MPPVGIIRRFFGSAVSNAAGYSVGGAITPTLEPLTQDIANEAWQLHTVKPISASAAAEASLRGLMGDAEAANEASMTGIDSARFGVLRRLASDAPALEALLALRRRGVIDEGTLDEGVAQLGLREQWRGPVKALANVQPSVTDMVRFAVREAFSPEQRGALNLDAEFPAAFREAASKIGLDSETAGLFWAAHWELPSLTQGAEMVHRGLISQAQFEGLAKALDYAPVWRDKLLAIAKPIPSLDDMIRFAVREVYSPAVRESLGLDADYPAEFTAQAALHGLIEEYARAYWAAHWRLPSPEQGFRMRHRKLISDAQLKTLLRALDYPPFWRDKLEGIAFLVPGRIDLKRMLRHGIKTVPQVIDGYERLGYAASDAQDMAEIARRELLGSATSSPWLNRARSRLFTVTHAEYLDGSIDAGRARALLTEIGAAAVEIDPIMELWDAEESIGRTELTVAQIRKAFKKVVFSREEALERLLDKGITGEDANVLLDTT